MPREPLVHSEGFRPVYPIAQAAPQIATGAIYNGAQSESFFGRGRSLKRTSTNDVVGSLTGGFLPIVNAAGGNIKSEGTGTADQTASLTGSVAVSVIDVMANGNLVLRGEKQLALTEGAEIIQVAGVVRPDDIAPNNTVQSRRLANAQITYRGTGDMAAATRAGWATSGLLKLWPF